MNFLIIQENEAENVFMVLNKLLCVPEWSYQNFDAILLKK